jgi:hypothetical protein
MCVCLQRPIQLLQRNPSLPRAIEVKIKNIENIVVPIGYHHGNGQNYYEIMVKKAIVLLGTCTLRSNRATRPSPSRSQRHIIVKIQVKLVKNGQTGQKTGLNYGQIQRPNILVNSTGQITGQITG